MKNLFTRFLLMLLRPAIRSEIAHCALIDTREKQKRLVQQICYEAYIRIGLTTRSDVMQVLQR